MTKMRAVAAAVLILAREGATQAFGIPGDQHHRHRERAPTAVALLD